MTRFCVLLLALCALVSEARAGEVIAKVLYAETAADLGTVQLTDGTPVYLQGTDSKHDGGEGWVVYDSSSTATVNGGLVYNGRSGNGRFLRVWDGQTINAGWWGLAGDGSTDDSADLQSALTALESTGGRLVIPSPTDKYRIDSGLTFTTPTDYVVEIIAYGATIEPNPANSITALTIDGGSAGGVVLCGLTIWARDNDNLVHGIVGEQLTHSAFVECTFIGNTSTGSYAGFVLRNATASDDATGSFWNVLERCHVKKYSGPDVGTIPTGVLLQGAANATRIVRCDLGNCDTGIQLENHSAQTTVPNSVQIVNTAIEGYTNGIVMDGAAASNLLGPSVIGCRFENGTTVFTLATITSQPSQPPYFAGNHFTSNAGTYLSNANNLYYTSLDASITPNLSGDGMHWAMPTEIQARNGTDLPLSIWDAGGGRGLHVYSDEGSTQLGQLVNLDGSNGRLSLNSNNLIFGEGASVINFDGSAKVDANGTAGNTRFLLYDVDTGALQRVKVGANGSGPGGADRALYIDAQ